MEMLFFPDDPGLSAAVENWWAQNYQLGKELGYPDCCIAAFCNQPPVLLNGKATDNDITRYKAALINGVYSGFIPCIRHAGMVLRGQISLADLIQNRNPHFAPFPDSSYILNNQI
jgi:hypothetical protein